MRSAVYIAIFIGFLRRLLRKMLAPSRRLPAASREVPGEPAEFALFLVEGICFYVVPGTAHVMDDDMAEWLGTQVKDEWDEYCGLVMKGLYINVFRTGYIDRHISELEVRLDPAARARLHCVVNGARATYSDTWRNGR